MQPTDRRFSRSFTALRHFTLSHIPQFPGRSKSFDSQIPETSSSKCCERCINLRDCGLVSSTLKPGIFYRSSQVVSPEEIQGLNLNAVLDLRVMKKPCKKHAHTHIQRIRSEESRDRAMLPPRSNSSSSTDLSATAEDSGVSLEMLELLEARNGTRVCPICTKEFGRKNSVAVPIFHSDLMPWQMKLRVFRSLPRRVQLQAIKEVFKFKSPESMVAAAVVDPHVMGPTILYQLILDHSHAAVAKALKMFCMEENFPALIHCIHGKDRTGLIVMLLLLLCDVPAKLVVADYIQSELQLRSGREDGALHELDDFLQSDNVIASKAETMVTTIAHLQERYGSIKEYARTIGLTSEEILRIRFNLMEVPEEKPTSLKQLDTYFCRDSPQKELEDLEKNEQPVRSQHQISEPAFRAAEEAIDEKRKEVDQGTSNRAEEFQQSSDLDTLQPAL